MEKQIITFSANEQILKKTAGQELFADDVVGYIEAHFDLGDNWTGYDSIRAVWFTAFAQVSTVLDQDGVCLVPPEVCNKKEVVNVNLVGSIVENNELTDRLTTYPIEAFIFDGNARVDGTETAPVTPSQFEQFVAIVEALVGSVKDIDHVALNADYTLTIYYSDGTSDTVGPIRGEQGPTGPTGNGIASIAKTGTSGTNPVVDTYTITYTNGQTTTFTVTNGVKGDTGATGNGIQSVYKTGTSGLVDTYTILYTNGNTTTFEVTNGQNGSLASSILAPTYSSSATYAVGDYVYYSGNLYRCVTAITTAEAWTSAHWVQVALAPEVADLRNELNELEGATMDMTDIEKHITYTFVDGEIHSGTHYADARRCYSELIDNVYGQNIYFDDTKYKVLLVFLDSDGTNPIYNTWVSTSPTASTTQASAKPKMRIEVQTKNDSNIDKADVAQSTYTIGQIVNMVKRRFGTVYVNGVSGSDSNDGSASYPFKTIQKGIDSGAGTVLVESQNNTYDEILTANGINGLRIAPIISSFFPAYGEYTPKIKISGGSGYSIAHAFNFSNCRNISLECIEAHHTSGAVAVFTNCFDMRITDCLFHDNNNSAGDGQKDGLQIENGSGIIRNCKAYNIRRDGFNIHGYGCTRFIDCEAFDCGDDGISHHDACTGTISGGEWYRCGKGGVASPTHGAYIDVDGVYSHDNAYGLYAMTTDESIRRRVKGRIRNCVFKNNSQFDIAIVSGDLIGIQNIYDTKSVSISTSATFQEFN